MGKCQISKKALARTNTLLLEQTNTLAYYRVRRLWISTFYSTGPRTFQGRLLDLPTNIILCWKGLPGTSTSYILQIFVNYVRKKFYKIGSWMFACVYTPKMLHLQSHHSFDNNYEKVL
jgi:hypothetical protein